MMIPWRAGGQVRQGIVRFWLAPVAFDPDVAVAVMIPVAVDPLGVGVGWFHVRAGDPDILVTVVAVVAGVPRPVGVLMRWWRDAFDRPLWRTDADDDLGLRNACGEKYCAGKSGEQFLHRAISLVLNYGTSFSVSKLLWRSGILTG
jgi:hypothetical protein